MEKMIQRYRGDQSVVCGGNPLCLFLLNDFDSIVIPTVISFVPLRLTLTKLPCRLSVGIRVKKIQYSSVLDKTCLLSVCLTLDFTFYPSGSPLKQHYVTFYHKNDSFNIITLREQCLVMVSLSQPLSPPVTCFCTLLLQREGWVSAWHTCLLHHASFQYTTFSWCFVWC